MLMPAVRVQYATCSSAYSHVLLLSWLLHCHWGCNSCMAAVPSYCQLTQRLQPVSISSLGLNRDLYLGYLIIHLDPGWAHLLREDILQALMT